MEARENPFRPGAGNQPQALVGRNRMLEAAEVCFHHAIEQRPARSIILVGLRGVGKTVLLRQCDAKAKQVGIWPIYIEAHEKKSLAATLAPLLRSYILQQRKHAFLKNFAEKALRTLRSFVDSIEIAGVKIDLGPEHGVADSGDIELDLPDLIESVATLAAHAKSAIAIMVDEIQYYKALELSAFIMALHRTTQKNLPVAFVGAGLPQIRGKLGESKSYTERLFQFFEVGPLEENHVSQVLEESVAPLGAHFNKDATEEICKITQGYPYFIQQWGFETWNIARRSPFTLSDVNAATDSAIESLDKGFFAVRFDRCTRSERHYMRALAELGDGKQRTGDWAQKIGVKPATLAPTRAKLINKGMIYSPSHGFVDFTVPLFSDYMRRVMDYEPPK